jgi:hypothetical protein
MEQCEPPPFVENGWSSRCSERMLWTFRRRRRTLEREAQRGHQAGCGKDADGRPLIGIERPACWRHTEQDTNSAIAARNVTNRARLAVDEHDEPPKAPGDRPPPIASSPSLLANLGVRSDKIASTDGSYFLNRGRGV